MGIRPLPALSFSLNTVGSECAEPRHRTRGPTHSVSAESTIIAATRVLYSPHLGQCRCPGMPWCSSVVLLLCTVWSAAQATMDIARLQRRDPLTKPYAKSDLGPGSAGFFNITTVSG